MNPAMPANASKYAPKSSPLQPGGKFPGTSLRLPRVKLPSLAPLPKPAKAKTPAFGGKAAPLFKKRGS